MNPGLELCNLQCCRGDRLLFDSLDAQTLPGQMLKVSGPNGAGKTSLLRMICGLLAPAEGKILWQGKTPSSMREEFGRQLVYIGHATATKDDLTALENLRISAVLGGTRISTDSGKAALTTVGLGRHIATPAGLLSQGQRRRLALARLAVSPASRLWVLDEPFTALDTAATQWLSALLLTHARQGGITVLTSHHDVPLDPAIRQIQVAL